MTRSSCWLWCSGEIGIVSILCNSHGEVRELLNQNVANLNVTPGRRKFAIERGHNQIVIEHLRRRADKFAYVLLRIGVVYPTFLFKKLA